MDFDSSEKYTPRWDKWRRNFAYAKNLFQFAGWRVPTLVHHKCVGFNLQHQHYAEHKFESKYLTSRQMLVLISTFHYTDSHSSLYMSQSKCFSQRR